MQIEYDKQADAQYVRIKNGEIKHTKKKRDWLLLDYDKNGEVLGIEILDASKNEVRISTEDGKLKIINITKSQTDEIAQENFGQIIFAHI